MILTKKLLRFSPFIPVFLRVFLLVSCWLLIFWKPLISAVSVWRSNDTYLHCFFIIPAVAYMIWSKRAYWLRAEPSPCYMALLPLILMLLLALVGDIADVKLFQHIAFFSLVPLSILLMVGWAVIQKMAFPLLFIMFSVPIGDELIPIFQDITADISVAFLKLSGVPVYRNGLFIDIPAGRFIVAEACSGVRFFIAALVFAAVYAYVSFTDYKRRIIYSIIAVVMPIIANGLRVYGTIMVADFFGMKYAAGADHLVYGWFFFSLVIIMLIIVGELMRSNGTALTNVPTHYQVNRAWLQVLDNKITVLLLALMLGYGGVAYFYSSPLKTNGLKLDVAELGVVGNNSQSWAPVYNGGEQVLLNLPVTKNYQAQLFIAYYETIKSKGELVSYQNRLFDIDRWTIKQRGKERILATDDQASFEVDSTLITSGSGKQRLIISWYETAQATVRTGAIAKLLQAYDRLVGGKGGGARVVISVPVITGHVEAAKIDLLRTATDNAEAIRKAIPF